MHYILERGSERKRERKKIKELKRWERNSEFSIFLYTITIKRDVYQMSSQNRFCFTFFLAMRERNLGVLFLLTGEDFICNLWGKRSMVEVRSREVLTIVVVSKRSLVFFISFLSFLSREEVREENEIVVVVSCNYNFWDNSKI